MSDGEHEDDPLPEEFGEQTLPPHAQTGEPVDIDHSAADRDLPGLHGEDRLPWLDSADDEFDEAGMDNGRVWSFVLAGLALLVLIVGGVYWTTHRGDQNAQVAQGSTIAAPPGPIKEAPANPGGKTFEGTGDSSFAVSQGKSPDAKLAANGDDGAAPAATPTAAAAAAKITKSAAPAAAATGVAVQVGAYMNEATAEAGWVRLAKTYDALSGVSHRIVEGTADIGTVYRLQAVAGSDDAAHALCDKLKAAGGTCQVKD